MQVNRIEQQTTGFKSNFVPNKILEQTFSRAVKENDRGFLKSVKTLLNDGKTDTIELQQKDSKSLGLYVNGEMADEGHSFLSYYNNAGSELIKKYTSKNVEHTNNYNNLSAKERKLVSEDVDLIKMLSDNFESFYNYYEEVQKSLKNIKQKIDDNTRQELQELQKIIFNK